MESDKPRGVSIHVETATGFKKPRVSIPIRRAVVGVANVLLNADTLSRSFSSGSIPIRAPLTVDEDDSSSLNDERYSASSDASNYSRRLDSETDDELEYASGDVDDETALEETVIEGIRVHSPLGEDSAGETGADNEFSVRSMIYRPFAGDIDEETSVNQFSFSEEESESSDNVDSVSESEVSEADRDSMKAKVVIPRAMLSLDDDELDEILGSDDEETALVRVVNALDNIEVKLEDNELLVENVGMIDKPECSDSVMDEFVSREEELVREHTLVEEQTLVVTPGAFSDCMVENEGNANMANMEFDETFKPVIEKEVVERGIAMDDGGGDTHEVDSLMKPSDEGVEDKAPEVEKLGMTNRAEFSVSVTPELISSQEEKGLEKFSGESFGTIDEDNLGVALGDCNEILVESEVNSVDANRESDENSCSLFEQRADQENSRKETNNVTDDCGTCESDATLILVGGSISLESRELNNEHTRDTINKAKDCWENDNGTVSIIGKPECTSEPETGLSSEVFQNFPSLDSIKGKNLEVSRGTDIVESGCGFTDQEAKQVSKNEGKLESEYIGDENGGLSLRSSLCDENGGSSLRSSFQKAYESVETEEQVSEQNNKDSEPNQISVGIEDTRTMPGNPYVSTDERMENEMQMADLIHDHTVMDLDEYEETSESTFPEGRLNLLMLCCAVKFYSKADSSQKHNTLIENLDLFGSKPCSFTQFCALWNFLLLGGRLGQASHLHKHFEDQKEHLLDSDPEILWEEQRIQECVEQDMNPVKNQPEDEKRGHEKSIRIRRGRFGIQLKKFTLYLDVSGLNTGFAINSRDYKKSFYSEKDEKEEGKISVRMRGSSMAVLGLIPVLMSVLSSVYGGK